MYSIKGNAGMYVKCTLYVHALYIYAYTYVHVRLLTRKHPVIKFIIFLTYKKNQLYMHPIGIHCHMIRVNDRN